MAIENLLPGLIFVRQLPANEDSGNQETRSKRGHGVNVPEDQLRKLLGLTDIKYGQDRDTLALID